ncbi:MAG: hypothetical protein WDA26_00045 [Pusillimonas sp.]
MSLKDAQKALAMIQRAKKRGRAAELTFSRSGQGEYNPETGEVEGGEITFAGTAVVLPASQGTVEAFDVRFERGTLIESTLRALLIAAHGMEHMPQPGDKVTFPDGSFGTMLGCTPLNPDGANPVIYQGTVKL